MRRRQEERVRRLMVELRFELLVLRRMEEAASREATGELTLADVHAAALLREVERALNP